VPTNAYTTTTSPAGTNVVSVRLNQAGDAMSHQFMRVRVER